MNTDLYERKNYLSNSPLKMKPKDWFSVNYRKETNQTVVKINTPRATINEAQNFKSFFNNNIAGTTKIIIDFGNCEFIDSTFIGTIVKIYNKFDSANKNLVLVVPNKKQASILIINKLDRIFKIYSNLEAALNHQKIN